MKIGCCARPEEISLVKELGFDYVELSGKVISAMNEDCFQALVSQLSQLELPCRNLNAYCPPEVQMAGPAYNKNANRAYAESLAGRAMALGVQCVCVGSPLSRRLPENFDRKLAVDQLTGFLSDMAEVFSSAKIKIGFEALGVCYCNFFNHMEETLPLLDRFPAGTIGLTVDFYNMEQSGEEELPLGPYLPHIVHAHISDDAGAPDKRDFLIPSRFPIHHRRLRRLISGGYDETISLEIDLPVRRTEAIRSLQLLRETCIS